VSLKDSAQRVQFLPKILKFSIKKAYLPDRCPEYFLILREYRNPSTEITFYETTK